MATALPIIATQVGGNAALLDDGRYGSLVPSENVTALAAEMLKQYSLREKQANLAARESIVEQYGLSAVLARYDNVFSRALSPAQRAHLA
jgi:glycosyltransferase involved in cell wall biosynthesis